MKRDSQPNGLVANSFPCSHMRSPSSTNGEAMFLQHFEDILTRDLSRKPTQVGDRCAVPKLVSLKKPTLLSIPSREVYEVPRNSSEGVQRRLRYALPGTARCTKSRGNRRRSIGQHQRRYPDRYRYDARAGRASPNSASGDSRTRRGLTAEHHLDLELLSMPFLTVPKVVGLLGFEPTIRGTNDHFGVLSPPTELQVEQKLCIAM